MQREGWSKLLQFYCADMLEQCQTKVFQSLSIEILCSHWQDLCLEVNISRKKSFILINLLVTRCRKKIIRKRT
jgi:hypothetical protein